MKRIAGYLAILALSLTIGAGDVAAAPSFENSKCWFPVTSDAPARCGYLLVPEERGKRTSRTLRLPVVIFEGSESAGGPKAEPILILNGGPGGKFYFANKNSRAFWTQMAKTLQVPASRDVILFSQRGTDNARAKLSECPVFNDPTIFLGASKVPGGETDMKVNFLKAFKECRAMLVKSGYPFHAYSTMASVADIGDLRSTLGLSKLAVYGVSYGAKLAVELARHQPRGLTRLVLDSPLPAEGNRMFHQVENLVGAMRQLSVICKEIRTCLAGADMEKDLAFLLKKLGNRPREIRLNTNIFQRDSQIYYVMLDPTILLDALFQSFYFQ
ncbi:MAG: alpha/beta hydrolase, partial [Sphingomonadales bacterium]